MTLVAGGNHTLTISLIENAEYRDGNDSFAGAGAKARSLPVLDEQPPLLQYLG